MTEYFNDTYLCRVDRDCKLYENASDNNPSNLVIRAGTKFYSSVQSKDDNRFRYKITSKYDKDVSLNYWISSNILSVIPAEIESEDESESIDTVVLVCKTTNPRTYKLVDDKVAVLNDIKLGDELIASDMKTVNIDGISQTRYYIKSIDRWIIYGTDFSEKQDTVETSDSFLNRVLKVAAATSLRSGSSDLKNKMGFTSSNSLNDSSANAVYNYGCKWVGRYLSTTSNSTKALSASEAEIINNHGMEVVTIYAGLSSASSASSNAGTSQCVAAKNSAKAVGAPISSIIFYEIPGDPSSTLNDKIVDYIRDYYKKN